MEKETTPVLLLTGYLGSGKTTLLNRILSNRRGIKFAVIVNDIGEVNIDADLIEKGGIVGSQDDSLVALQNGCICCTLKMDLVEQLRDIIKMQKFDYIVIEASGICEPAPIAQTICSIPQLGEEYVENGYPVLDSIVTVVDALRMKDEFGSGNDLLRANIDDEDIENLVIQQIEFCNIVLLNKAAEVEPQELQRIKEIVRALQPKATIFAGESDESDFRWPGNEMGALDPDARATIETVGGFADGRYGNPRYREQINAGSPGGAFFRACECDFPLRKGWFWRESERGTTKSGETLARLYLGTVGNGGTMNVGIAPDATGRLDEEDVRALARFGELRRALFAEPVESGPANLVELREDIACGERVDGWRLLCGAREVARGRAVGLRRIRVFADGAVPDAAALRAEATAFAGAEAPVLRVAAYRADPAVLRAVLAAAGSSGETDTANWMTGRR